VISGVARVPCARGKIFFAPSPTKTAKFELKNRCKARNKQKHNICYLLLRYFSKYSSSFNARNALSTNLYINKW